MLKTSAGQNGDETVLTLAVDAHGGDYGPPVMVDAAVDAINMDSTLRIRLYGDEVAINHRLKAAETQYRDHVTVHSAPDLLPADAKPRDILRHGANSSMGLALSAVADGTAQACVSAGNTTGLMTLGLKLVGRLPHVKRPALMSHVPTTTGLTGLLDLGANLQPDATQLFQFALMGSVAHGYGRSRNTNQLNDQAPARRPSIGLLNVGHEDSKGHAVVREAHDMLLKTELNYQGFIEGHDLFAGKVDVAVCDGFAGNLILKSSEGLAGMLFQEIRRTLESTWRSRFGAALAKPALRGMLERLDPGKHNGAPLLGLQGVVIKSHGRSDQAATLQAILEAGREARKHVPERIAQAILQTQEIEEAE